MGIGWDELGNLKQYPTKESMKEKMKVAYGEEYSYKIKTQNTQHGSSAICVAKLTSRIRLSIRPC